MLDSKDYSLIPQLDERVIATLMELNDPEDEVPFVEGLILLYFKEAPLALNNLDRAIDQCDKTAIVHWSHKLIGLSRNLGLSRLSAICATIEEGTEILGLSEQIEVFKKSQAELDVVIVTLSGYLTSKAA